MTDVDLDAITARANAATPEPWLIDPSEQGFITKTGQPFITAPYHELDIRDDDAEFIAHAREDVPALVAAVREAREAATWAQLAADTQKERADLLQAAVARAPHDNICGFGRMHGLPCGCWKAGL
jgi:hypothetical protein